ncbi:MAG: GSU2403 family nucleotidyltransferase fold protein [Pseudomonadota bacterium]
MLIGSWCIPFYESYFQNEPLSIAIRTRDIDFLIPKPEKMQTETDVPGFLGDLGFIVEFTSSTGCMRLFHPDLIVEFLVPDIGRGRPSPFPVPKIKINAQPLRFLSLLAARTIRVKIGEYHLTLPHHTIFALHKLIISSRRKGKDKSFRDQETAFKVLSALEKKGELEGIREAFVFLPGKWQKVIGRVLKDCEPSFPFLSTALKAILLSES